MKKILLSMLFLFTLIFLVACDDTITPNPDPDPDPNPDPDPIISVPNGLQPLEATPDVDPFYATLEGGWVSVWADEFYGDTIDTSKWNITNSGGGFGNNELQYYSPNNVEIIDGKLVITARKETYSGHSYTSAKLTSLNKGDFKYGRIQVRAKLPTGRGTWPAIWMMPSENMYGGWPNSGEIDIMEYVGYTPNYVHSTIHTTKGNGMNGQQIGYDMNIADPDERFYTYEIIWEPGYIQAYVEGVPYDNPFIYVPEFNQNIPYQYTFPFDQYFYLILNFAIGGNWGGVQGVDDSIFPQQLEIDYVRVYQKDYASIDTEIPSTVDEIHEMSGLVNGIYWDAATDDAGVEQYGIYVDGKLSYYSNLNQFQFRELEPGNYSIAITAIDFVGRESALGTPYNITIE